MIHDIMSQIKLYTDATSFYTAVYGDFSVGSAEEDWNLKSIGSYYGDAGEYMYVVS